MAAVTNVNGSQVAMNIQKLSPIASCLDFESKSKKFIPNTD